ncbi:MAG: FtsX-like permease family protein [Hespellia sp.]|nr:FtsX-like permease family protein [Hespellia sp.]
MKITAKMAYSQLKVNRSRTLWAIAAIALSTALTTTVCSFVASGNAMIVGFLGADYGEYGSAYMGMLLVPAILFGIIIVTMSVIVISNVFRISAGERISQFGILKCVGATEKQIMESVLYEGIFLSAAGIPAGLVLGFGFTAAGIGIANHYLDELNALAHIMITEIHLHVTFVLSWQALLISCVISFLAVMYSARRPARKASRIVAAESARGSGNITVKHVNRHTGEWIQRIFGSEGALAAKNIKRNHQNFRATFIALSAGIILFISLGSLSSQAARLEDLMKANVKETVLADYISARQRGVNEKTGKRESIYLRPIESERGEVITEKLKAYDGNGVFGVGIDSETYQSAVSNEDLTSEMKEALTYENLSAEELPVEITTLDHENYQKLCEKAGVDYGSIILLNQYSYNKDGEETQVTPYRSSLKHLVLTKADGSREEIVIEGMIEAEEVPEELIHFNVSTIRLVLPEATVRGYSWYCAPEDVDGFIAYADDVLKQEFPEEENASYMEAGFSTRVYRIDDYVKVMNISIVLILVFMYSFVAILMLIGFTNVVSTMTTNVLMRSQEFAVLQSVGMTPEGLRKMLNFESLLCSAKSLAIGVPIGVVLTWLMNKPIRKMYPIQYELPWLMVILCMIGVFAITCGITNLALRRLSSQNIIESIRSDRGM